MYYSNECNGPQNGQNASGNEQMQLITSHPIAILKINMIICYHLNTVHEQHCGSATQQIDIVYMMAYSYIPFKNILLTKWFTDYFIDMVIAIFRLDYNITKKQPLSLNQSGFSISNMYCNNKQPKK